MTYKTKSGAHPEVQINVLNELPVGRFTLALQRFRASIRGGRPKTGYDDDSPGNKSTSCSWGLCSENKADWPDAQDHVFPLDFERRGRMSPLGTPKGHKCPLDKRPVEKVDIQGCFYTCRFFSSRKGDEPLTRELAIRLYDEAIKLAQPATLNQPSNEGDRMIQQYQPLQSSNLKEAAWIDGDLYIRFNKGTEYKYTGVPLQVYKDLLAAESHGKFFHANIIGKYQFERTDGGATKE